MKTSIKTIGLLAALAMGLTSSLFSQKTINKHRQCNTNPK
jgi:hypothetical protein